jgi:hypothetical protein
MQNVDLALALSIAIALAVIFGVSGALKLRDLELFAGSIANYRLLPAWLEAPFAYLIPLAECACSAAILFSATRVPAAASLAILLCLFTGAIAINLARGRVNIDCGCFGPALRQNLSGWLLLRNFVLFAMVALVALPASVRTLEWLDGFTIALGAATLVILYASANYTLGNMPGTRALEML